jgi:hypothetical protein
MLNKNIGTFLVFIVLVLSGCRRDGVMTFSPEPGKPFTIVSEYKSSIIQRIILQVQVRDFEYNLTAQYTPVVVDDSGVLFNMNILAMYAGPGEGFRNLYNKSDVSNDPFDLQRVQSTQQNLIRKHNRLFFRVEGGDIKFLDGFADFFADYNSNYKYMFQGFALGSTRKLFDLEKGLKKNLNTVFGFYPDGEVVTGSSWSGLERSLNSGEMYVNFAEYYKASSVGDKAVIKISHAGNSGLAYDHLSELERFYAGFSFKGIYDVKGKIVCDTKSGLIIKREQENKADGRIVVSAFNNSGADQKTPFLLKEKISVRRN